MGTRADFYTRSTKGTLRYVGSIAWGGHPDNIPNYITGAGNAAAFCHGLYKWFKHDRDDATTPKQGYPWPWSTSRMTDYTYVFDARSGRVRQFRFGKPINRRGRPYKWPDMTSMQKVALGERSGLLIF